MASWALLAGLVAVAGMALREARAAEPDLPQAAFRERAGDFLSNAGSTQSRVRPDGSFRVTSGAAALELQTLKLGREESPSKPAARVRRSAPSLLSIDRGSAREELLAGPSGLEQRWHFEAPPPGRGPLEVRIVATAPGQVEQSPRGLLFRSGRDGILYGHGTWVDADGARTAVAAVHRDGQIILSVPARVLERSRFPAVLDPVISGEISFGNPLSGEAENYQWNPAVAFDGTNFLAAWDDRRSHTGSDIFAERISPTGLFRDQFAVRISDSGFAFTPAAAFGAGVYLIAWADRRTGSADIYAARLAPDGGLLDSTPFPISTAVNEQRAPFISFDGSAFLVGWEDRRQDGVTGDLYGARVTPGGAVLDPSGFPISTAPFGQQGGAAVFDGVNHLVAWSDLRSNVSFDVYLARVSPEGAVLDGQGVVVANTPSDEFNPKLAFGPAGALVAWLEGGGAQVNVRATRVSSAAALLDSPPLPMRVAPGERSGLSAAADDAGFSTFFIQPPSDVRQARWTPDGGVSNTHFSWRAHLGDRSAAVFGAGLYFEAHHDEAGIFAALGPPGGTNIWSEYASRGASAQYSPSVTWNGQSHLVSWVERVHQFSSAIFTLRVGEDGIPLAVAPTRIDDDYWITQVGVASNGTGFLVVWDSNDVQAAQVGADGSRLNVTPIRVATGMQEQGRSKVASDGTDYLVVWEEHSGSSMDIRAARVSSAGMVLDPSGLPIATSSNYELAPQVAFDGTHYVVAFHCPSCGGHYASRVTPGGSVLDDGGVRLGPSSEQSTASIASLGAGTSLIVWNSNATGTHDLTGVLFGADADGGVHVLTQPGDQLAPTVTAVGTGYLVAWEDYRAGQLPDLWALRLTASGTVQEQPFLVTQSPSPEWKPALSASSPGRALIAYERYQEGPLWTRRLHARALGDPPANGPDGGLDAGAPLRPPSFLTQPSRTAICNAPYHYSDSNLPQVDAEGPLTFSLRGISGAPLPKQMFIHSETGEILWRPDPSQEGLHRFELVATGPGGALVQQVEVEVSCPNGGRLNVGCGCSSPGLSQGGWALLLAGVLRTLRSRRGKAAR